MKKIVLLICVFFLGSTDGLCDGFASLKLGSHARAEALGMAFTALSDDGSAGFWNPAGLARLRRTDVILSLHHWIEDVRSEFLGLGWGGDRSGLGIHVLYTNMGEIEHRTVPSPTPITKFSAHELIIGGSYARQIFHPFSMGMTVKMLYEKIFVEEAWGLAADVGLLYQVWEGGPMIGGVIQNMGKTNALHTENITLPLTVRLGLSHTLEFLGGGWTFVMDGVKERGFPFHLHGGLEFGWHRSVFLRLGYQSGYQTRDVTGGLGVTWGRYRLDYSYMPLGSGLGDSHHLTFGVGW